MSGDTVVSLFVFQTTYDQYEAVSGWSLPVQGYPDNQLLTNTIQPFHPTAPAMSLSNTNLLQYGQSFIPDPTQHLMMSQHDSGIPAFSLVGDDVPPPPPPLPCEPPPQPPLPPLPPSQPPLPPETPPPLPPGESHTPEPPMDLSLTITTFNKNQNAVHTVSSQNNITHQYYGEHADREQNYFDDSRLICNSSSLQHLQVDNQSSVRDTSTPEQWKVVDSWPEEPVNAMNSEKGHNSVSTHSTSGAQIVFHEMPDIKPTEEDLDEEAMLRAQLIKSMQDRKKKKLSEVRKHAHVSS